MHHLRFILLTWLALACPLALADDVHAVVFMYHRFDEGRYPSTSVRLAQFENHLDYLAREGYRVWPLRRIVQHLRHSRPIPDHTVAITMDDAYRSVYTHAYPRLKARGWPFTVFVSTDVVDQRLPDFMQWEQMREMAGDGVDFANHSAAHEHLIARRAGEDERQWNQRVRADLLRAQARLVSELGEAAREAPTLFAYPFGEYDTDLANLVADLGWVGFGQQSGAIGSRSDRRALPRYPIAETYAAIDDFAVRAASLPLSIAAERPWEPSRPDNPPRLELLLSPDGADVDRLACYASGQGAIPIQRVGPRHLVVRAPQPLPAGRTRYNCTAPSRDGRRYHWYSHPWFIPPIGTAPGD